MLLSQRQRSFMRSGRKPRTAPMMRVCWASTGAMVSAGEASKERIEYLRKLFERR